MKSTNHTFNFAILSLTATFLTNIYSGESMLPTDTYVADAMETHHGTGPRPDSHAPIGVMGEHTHHAGEFMLSYRYMDMRMAGNLMGSDHVSAQEIFDLGYEAAASSMDMDMHMFGLMWAPADWVTLSLMTQYVRKDMSLTAAPMEMGMEEVGHDGDHGHAHSGKFSHRSEGWGDTSVNALIPLWQNAHQSVHLTLGLGVPTAEVEAKDTGVLLPYGMQLGRGLWDFRTGVTYAGHTDNYSWGAQLLGTFGLEDENDAGFKPGDLYEATAWSAIRVTKWASLSARLRYEHQEGWGGHYDGAHGHGAPQNLIDNYGGNLLEGGLGLNLVLPAGPLRGNRLAVEALFPIHQDVEGVQLERDWTLTLGWQWAF